MGAHRTNSARGHCLRVAAQWQADPFMAGEILAKRAVMVFSTDTDIPLLSEDCCISIKGFAHKNVQIVCTSKANLEKVLKFIPDGSNAKMVDAEYPIFQGISDHWLRALMMVILGCDVYTSGLKGCGITTLLKHISSCNNTEDKLKDESVLFQHPLQIMKKEF